MNIVQLPSGREVENKIAVFDLGFRPFFLGGIVFSILSMFVWAIQYLAIIDISTTRVPAVIWHAHEMIYGYCLAIIAGFLLTAVENWTGSKTLSGKWLASSALLWVGARIFFIFDKLLVLAACLDIAFVVFIGSHLTLIIVRSGQWRQMAVVTKLLILGLGNISFYLGVFGILDLGVRWGIYGGFYLVIGLILTIARRVFPMFIEQGLECETNLRNYRWLDLGSLVLFLAFYIVEVFTSYHFIAVCIAGGLFAVHLTRALCWYDKAIWGKTLLWSLWLSYLGIVFGFFLFFISYFSNAVSVFLAIHCFAVGGIGLVTLAMMARVSLGHTGRSVHKPSRYLVATFLIFVGAFVARVVMPVFMPTHYSTWVLLSQVFWILSFTIFLLIYFNILIKPSQRVSL